MRAAGLFEFGGPEVLQLVELPPPGLPEDRVLVRVRAAGVNAADVLFRTPGAEPTPRQHPAPWVPGMDLAGEVAAVGRGANTDLVVGDRVFGWISPMTTGRGAYAEQVAISPSSLARTPESFTDIEAATLPTNGLTAMHALDLLSLPAGATVAITGSAGGTGVRMVELAVERGLQVIAVASPADERLVADLGAQTFVVRGPEVERRLLEVVPEGVAAIVDTALLGPSLSPALAPGGTLMPLRGAHEVHGYDTSPRSDVTVRRPFVPDYAVGRQDKLDELDDLIRRGVFRPRVADVYPLEKAADAHLSFESGGIRGRLVLSL